MESFEHSLPAGSVIDNRYRVESVLGEGGFAITYKAFDTKLEYPVAIKEFLPIELAARSSDTRTVQARTNRNDDYAFGLSRFLDEAKTLAKFQHPHIVRVINFIEENGTAYLVMEYAEGQELGDWLKTQPGQLSEEAILGIIRPVVDGLVEVHKQGLLHRDIKPGNLILRQNAGPMLIDFGAARHALGEKSKSISAIISQGYAPPEQYTTRGKQGAYTDLYAVGATLYKLITASTPLESSDRAHDLLGGEPDPLIPAIEAGKGRVSDWLLQLTDQLLCINPKERPQSAEAVLKAIDNKTMADVSVASSAEQSQKNKTRVVKSSERFEKQSVKKTAAGSSSQTASDKKNKMPLIAAVLLLSIGVVGGGWWFLKTESEPQTQIIKKGEDQRGGLIAEVQAPANKLSGVEDYRAKIQNSTTPAETFQDHYQAINANYQAEYKKSPTGETIFQNLCSLCHGDAGAGSKIAPALNDAEADQLASIKYTINHGVNDASDPQTRSSDMPQWGTLLSEKEIRQVAEYISNSLVPETKQKQEVEDQGVVKQQRIERLAGKMINVPAGSFQMGGSRDYEKPIHRVDIKAFKLGQYEVTQKQWQAVMGNNPSRFKGCDDCPVEKVSWKDVQGFIKQLNQKTGQRFRLPSEAEWEYACRSGGKDEKYCGGNNASTLAWYDQNSNVQTHPVGQKQANGLGLYDMSGNVWEWTQDCANASYNGAPTNGEPWLSGDCTQRIVRGGFWANTSKYTRSTQRYERLTYDRHSDFGFRLAQDVQPEQLIDKHKLEDLTLESLGEENMLVYTPRGVNKHTITAFVAIKDPYSRKLHRDLDQYLAAGVKVRYIFMPVFGDKSFDTAVSVWCAANSQQALDNAMTGKSVEEKTCNHPVEQHKLLASKMKVDATPTIILDNGMKSVGYSAAKQVIKHLEKM